MKKVLLGWNIILTIFLVVLSVVLVQTRGNMEDVGNQLRYQLKYIEDEFVQEDDLSPTIDNVFALYEKLENKVEGLEHSVQDLENSVNNLWSR